MEEILASIRRIIADEDATDPLSEAGEPTDSPSRAAAALSPTPPHAAPPQEPTETDQEIDSMLTRLQAGSWQASPADEPGATERSAEPSSRGTDRRREAAIERGAPEHYHAARATEEPRGGADVGERGLLSTAATAAVNSAFTSLAQAVEVRNGRTLEDLVSELIRPMLKAWLDENLPDMVERLVRAEIERVTRGRS